MSRPGPAGRLAPVLPPSVAETETAMLEGVVQYGTGKAAAIGQFAAGKTGTTENYGDAWFVGWDSKYTVAVWVGYPNGLVPMTNDFNGGPVLGGTFPALIWHDFITSAASVDKLRAERAAEKGATGKGSPAGSTSGTEVAPLPSSGGEAAEGTSPSGRGKGSAPSQHGGGKSPTPAPRAGSEESGSSQGSAAPAAPEATHQAPAPAPKAAPSPPPETAPAPTGGVGPSG